MISDGVRSLVGENTHEEAGAEAELEPAAVGLVELERGVVAGAEDEPPEPEGTVTMAVPEVLVVVVEATTTEVAEVVSGAALSVSGALAVDENAVSVRVTPTARQASREAASAVAMSSPLHVSRMQVVVAATKALSLQRQTLSGPQAPVGVSVRQGIAQAEQKGDQSI
jgi:hypothetical protein